MIKSVCIIIAICTATVYAQSDSLLTTQLLDSALLNVEKQRYYLQKVDLLEQKNSKNPSKIAIIWGLKAKFYLRQGQVDKASELVNKGIKRFDQHPDLKARFYGLEGNVFAVQKKFDDAIRSYQLALKQYDQLKMVREAAYLKNNIANVFFNLNDFESAYSYAKESFDVVYELKDTIYYPQIAAILAISEVKTNRVSLAETHAQLAIDAGKQFKNPLAVIIGKYAMGDVYSSKQEWNNAKTIYNEVVVLSEQIQLRQYEAYGRIGLLTCNIALRIYNEAIEEGEKVIELNNITKLHFADYTVYQQLSEAYHAIGNNEKAFQHLRTANEMYREYSSVENKKVIQELLTKYETEKKERNLSQKELELTRAIIWILGLIFVLFLFVVMILWTRKRAKNRLKTVQIESERNQLQAFVDGEERERERLAADIHDGIASTLTGLSLQIQQVQSLDEIKPLIEHLEAARNEVRLISKNILPFNLKEEGWKNSFQRFISSVQSPVFSIFFLAEFDESQLNNQRGMVVYRILQELIQNTLKHANATECELMITEENGTILIQYSDNGNGTSQEQLEKGNGWQSILTRLTAIDGVISLPKNPLDGLKIDIALPKV